MSHTVSNPSAVSHNSELVSFLQNLIRIPSLSPVSPELAAPATSSLDYIEDYLSRHGAACQRLVFDGEHEKWGYAVDNLYAEWSFGRAEKHLCFMGHTDVVPPGDISRWSKDPYSGELEQGWIYGRGATDMKGAVAAFCNAAVNLRDDLQSSNIRLSLLITTDEEWAAINGSRRVLEWLKKNNHALDAVIVGEPSSSDIYGSHIKVGRRGSLCGRLTVEGVQGHAAYKDLYENPNRTLSLANTILNCLQWEHSLPYFPPTHFEIVCLQSGEPGMTSIVPEQADSYWNVRFTPEYTVPRIIDTMRDSLETPPDWARAHPDADGLANVAVIANSDTASLPYYSEPDELATIVQKSVERVTGTAPELDGQGGTTDGRFVHTYFPDAQIVELGIPEKGGLVNKTPPKDYGSRGGMHQVNERCSIKDIEDLSMSYREVIKNYSESATGSSIKKYSGN